LVVTFDAPYLLRASADKARAWADLCLALELVAPAA
jgi:DNA polymerase